MLDRIGGEKARATSLVRYAPGSSFPTHIHSGGEEILVLSGTFSDASADHPAGWYLRNPPGSTHAPSSTEGAIIFVKLGQMAATEGEAVRIDTRDTGRWQAGVDRQQCLLFHDAVERVSLQRLTPARRLLDAEVAGAEILVLAGTLMKDGQEFPAHAWLRLPKGAYPGVVAGPTGATVYLKTGCLGRTFDSESTS